MCRGNVKVVVVRGHSFAELRANVHQRFFGIPTLASFSRISISILLTLLACILPGSTVSALRRTNRDTCL